MKIALCLLNYYEVVSKVLHRSYLMECKPAMPSVDQESPTAMAGGAWLGPVASCTRHDIQTVTFEVASLQLY